MSVGNIIGSILFGGIGFVAFAYGKRMSSFKAMGVGILLMVYPYFVPNTLVMYLVGGLLTASLYIFRD